MKVFLILGYLVTSASASLGFDSTGVVTTSQFQCMKNNNYTFYLGRLFKAIGKVDEDGIQNVINAKAGGMTTIDGYIFPCTTIDCPSPGNQVIGAIDAVTAANATVNTVWIDVEIYKWPSDTQANKDFILSMGSFINNLGYNWGIYTKALDWTTIVGGVTDFSSRPLWWSSHNGNANNGNFKSFGGWTSPTVHQYSISNNGPCGFNIDLDYSMY